jgi:DNA-binding response OmpR family regulator
VAKRKLNIILTIQDASTRLSFLEILRVEGHSVDEVATLADAIDLQEKAFYDLLLADLELPGEEAEQFLNRWKEKQPDTLVVVVAADGKIETAVHALRAGVFDYLIRPTMAEELVATIGRARAVLDDRDRKREAIRIMEEMLQHLKGPGDPSRRPYALRMSAPSLGGIRLDVEKRHATLSGRALDLTPTEFDLLALLVSHPDEPFSSEEILAKVKGFSPAPISARAAVRVYMSRLRHKVEENPSDPRFLRTVRGVGYVYQEPKDG